MTLIEGEGTDKQYYVTDPHGNVVQLTDESGNVIKTYEYDSFGNEVKPEKKDENPFRYCGEYYDKAIEEIYLRARYYQPKVGRFITRDTYTGESDDPLSLHLYTYCGNDGVNRLDLSGHDSFILYDKKAKAGTPGKMFEDEAKIVKKKLEKKYHKPCHLIPFTSAKDFKRLWDKSVGYRFKLNPPDVLSEYIKMDTSVLTKKRVKIHEVYIISHGGITGNKSDATGYMNFTDESRIYARRTNDYNSSRDVLVPELKKKRIKKITFSCCNTANPDCYHIANAFRMKMKVKTIVGFDGGARFDYDDERLKKGFDKNQKTWYKYAPTRRSKLRSVGGPAVEALVYSRKRMGIRTYKNGSWTPIIYY